MTSDSITSSDDGSDHIDGAIDTSRMTEAEAADTIFYRYKSARRQWRRFTGKLVKRFRKFFRRSLKGKGRGRIEGRGRGFYYTGDEVKPS